jgi:hypothetical protein
VAVVQREQPQVLTAQLAQQTLVVVAEVHPHLERVPEEPVVQVLLL